MKRAFGVLMHVSSLPNKYGIGTFGKEAYDFIDYLKAAGASYWQVLPLNQTGFGNSPYQSPASDSLNPYFISPEILSEEGLITKKELAEIKDDAFYVDYGKLYFTRYPLLRKAFNRFDKTDEDFIKFVKKGRYKDYALFMAIKNARGQKAFCDWESGLKYRDKKALKAFAKENAEELLFWQFVQYKAAEQWAMLKGYAKKCGVKIIGDMPLYAAYDSVDVWKDPSLFKLDGDLRPVSVAGVPPDYFSATGQVWGNPVFDYDRQRESGFSWWVKRIKNALTLYDIVRIDHFRGLDRYFEIPAGSPTAIGGRWADVPHDELFSVIKSRIKDGRIIAEDLGILDDGVYELLEKTGYPGMCVLSFAFNGDKDNKYLPEHIKENSVCYTGTHDNNTLAGLIENLSDWDKNNLLCGVKNSLDFYGLKGDISETKKLAEKIIELGFASKAYLFIIPVQDILLKGGEYRMNEPSTDKPQNWAIRFTAKDFTAKSAAAMKKLKVKYLR